MKSRSARSLQEQQPESCAPNAVTTQACWARRTCGLVRQHEQFDPASKSDNLRPQLVKRIALPISDMPRVTTNLHALIFISAILIAFCAEFSFAQSTDQSLPTPVLSNEISGTIRALDVGDPRLTRHFYAFEAMPGDLLITVNSRNLNGDVDIFTAVTFRPLTKITIYANT